MNYWKSLNKASNKPKRAVFDLFTVPQNTTFDQVHIEKKRQIGR